VHPRPNAIAYERLSEDQVVNFELAKRIEVIDCTSPIVTGDQSTRGDFNQICTIGSTFNKALRRMH
jgi:hypothetical protein